MSLVLFATALMLQTGPIVGDGIAPSLGLPMIDRPTGPNRRRAVSEITARPERVDDSNKLTHCRETADHDPDAAAQMATDWLSGAKDSQRAEAELCLGYAYSAQEAWPMAEQAFLAGRDAAGDNALNRARLGAMAASAAQAQEGGADRALAALDKARVDAKAVNDPALMTSIAVDRARALVALKRNDEAAASLAEARTQGPDNGPAWLLSATLSRRMGHLADAQTQIQTAARLTPLDPEVGLEAGVIAMLSGHEDAARKSWESTVKASPQSEAGHQASAYLQQIGGTSGANAPSPSPTTGANSTSTQPSPG